MAFQWQININSTGQSSPRAAFDPGTLNASARDQIFWTNNDTEPHWPGPKDSEGNVDQDGWFPNQIAGRSEFSTDTSAQWSPSLPGSYPYACSLHPNEEGTIIVT